MKRLLRSALCVALILMVPAAAFALQAFDFNGQAKLPTAVGGTLDVFSVVFDGSPAVSTPIALDFANYEYTLVISGTVLNADGMTQLYAGGTITLYEDNGTPADFANPSTFTDGTALLVGNLNTLSRSVLIPPVGSVNGTLDWVGGTRIGEIAPADRLNWPLLSGTHGGLAEPGYDEKWDGKVEPQGEIVATEEESLGSLKSRF